MAPDNVSFQTASLATPPDTTSVATRLATHAGDSANVQVIHPIAALGSEGSYTLREFLVQDDAAFTPGTNAVAMFGAEFDDTAPDSVDEGDAGALRMSGRRELYIQVRDAAGNERGLVIDAAGYATVNINGTVTVGSHAVTNAGTFAVQATAVGTIADDATTPGNPVMVGGFAISPDGSAPGQVAEADVARFRTDLNRRLLVNDEHPHWVSFHSDGSTALTDQEVFADPGDGFQLVVTEISFSTGSATACNIFFEEGATKVLGPWYLEAVAGRGLVWRGKKHITASTALTVTTSASIAQSVDVQGYIQAV